MIRYQFPVLDNIDPLLRAIEGREEFSKHIKQTVDGRRYQVLDYHVNFHDTFPELIGEPEDLTSILRRECRGLIADPDTGVILSRPWHKFHNVNERPSTSSHLIDLSQPHVLLEKMDGSMVRPFIPRGGDLQWNTYPTRPALWGTMAGVTDVSANALAFIEQSNFDYDGFAHEWLDRGYTPLFEWCSRRNRIVVDHPVDKLVLTGIRHRTNGTYLFDEEMREEADVHGIPCVEGYSQWADIEKLIAHTRALDPTHEGFVVRFRDGHMIKIKADAYCRIHKTKEHLVFEKNMVQLILRKEIDDVMPDFPESDQARIRSYTDSVLKNIYAVAGDLMAEVMSKQNLGQREFADSIQRHPYRGLLFSIRQGSDARDVLITHVLKYSTTGPELEKVRNLIGPKWETF